MIQVARELFKGLAGAEHCIVLSAQKQGLLF